MRGTHHAEKGCGGYTRCGVCRVFREPVVDHNAEEQPEIVQNPKIAE